MKLIFEKSRQGRGCSVLQKADVNYAKVPEHLKRQSKLRLPELSETDLVRHYTELSKRTYGLNNGFYPLGSCTMKLNPKVNDEIANYIGFSGIHPLQPEHTVQGCLEVLSVAEERLCEITGMDHMTFQPAAGAHGEFTGLLLMKAYHKSRNDVKRTKIIVPDSAHGTNPASAVMAGFTVITVPSTSEGYVDTEKLKEVVGDDTAGLMITNPNTVGLFEKNIIEIAKIIHGAGGLLYYDGANLNAIMGIVRPGDMGFDVIHLNLHKTFSTPHGGGGPGSGPVGCKERLAKFLPVPYYKKNGTYSFDYDLPESIGRMKAFYGNFLVVVRALAYIETLGHEGILEASENAVLNANYLMSKLSDLYEVAYSAPCMHEFVLSIEELKKSHGVTAMDIAKSLLDYGMHPPTMYFPMIVHEALMIEPTETESIDVLDEAAEAFRQIYKNAVENSEMVKNAPINTAVARLDEVNAARNPKLAFRFTE